jgi:hypothetical protein
MPTRATSAPALDSRYRRELLWKVRTLTMGSVVNVTEALCDKLPLVAVISTYQPELFALDRRRREKPAAQPVELLDSLKVPFLQTLLHIQPLLISA